MAPSSRFGRSYVKKSIGDSSPSKYDGLTFTTTTEMRNGRQSWIIRPSQLIRECAEEDCSCRCRADVCGVAGKLPDGVGGGIAGALVGSLVGGILGEK